MKKIKDFDYYVDEFGDVYNSSGKKLKPFVNPDGYRCLTLYLDKKKYHKRICRLVAETFISNPNNLPVVNHKNSIRSDDRVENLEWCTVAYNAEHGATNNPDKYKAQAIIDYPEVHKICALLQDGLRSLDIAEILGVSKDIIDHISKKKTWKEVSKNYTFPPKGSRVGKATALWVYDRLQEGKTYQWIVDNTTNKRLSIKIVSLIDSKRIYKEIFD